MWALLYIKKIPLRNQSNSDWSATEFNTSSQIYHTIIFYTVRSCIYWLLETTIPNKQADSVRPVYLGNIYGWRKQSSTIYAMQSSSRIVWPKFSVSSLHNFVLILNYMPHITDSSNHYGWNPFICNAKNCPPCLPFFVQCHD